MTLLQATTLPFKVRARYGWSGQTKGDLGFLEGDIMEVTRVAGDWFYGRLLRNKKCAGYFPNNFVIPLEERLNEAIPLVADMSNTVSSKVSIPPVPSRSVHKQQSKMTYSQSSPTLPKLSRRSTDIEQSSRTRDDIGDYSMKRPSYRRQDPSESKDNSIYMKRSSRGSRLQESLNGPLPPLPPLPKFSKQTDKAKTPIKSYPSNDINKSHSRDYAYYEDNQKFYDGFYPNKKSAVSDSNSSSSAGLFSNSHYMDNSMSSSENSFALMSDFSATSAGSFARHKYAQSFTDSFEKSQAVASNNEQYNNTLNSSSRMGGLLRKIIPMGKSGDVSNDNDGENYPKLPDLEDLNISRSHDDARDWVTVKSHINRSRTLTKYEKHPRYMRALENNRDLVLHPQDSIYNGLNTNEVKANGQPGIVDIELTELNREYIDSMTRKRCLKEGSLRLDTWAQTTFSARYASTIEKLRGIYIFCTEMFALIDDNGESDFSHEPSNLDKKIYQKYCTPYELTWIFKKLTNALGITCEIVIGFLKTPGININEFKYNHCWLRVLVNKEWRLVDVILGNITNPIHEFVNNRKAKKAEESYFLAQPLEFIYTHVPPREFEQHIVPSIDQLSVLYLPLVFPSYFKNALKLYKYSTALAYLEDSEVYECQLEIPSDIEIFASVGPSFIDDEKSETFKNMDLALTQVKKHKTDSSRRIAIIKAVLPPGVKDGLLYIHSGLRGTQITIANVHPLSMMISLSHKGNESKFEFVTRLPSENLQKLELYILEPQNKYLFTDNEYNFEVIQQPFDGVMYNASGKTQNQMQKLAIQSPSGKIYELNKNDPNFAYGTWKAIIKAKEKGKWTGLVVADSGIGWCPFAQWSCI